MKSPFPGFDPYLLQSWGDVHQSLAIYARNAIQPNLPNDLRARTEERVYVEHEDGADRFITTDVTIFERPARDFSRSESTSSVAVLEPVATLTDEPVTESFIEIREKGGGKLVTVIEFISPTNKIPGSGRQKYIAKQRELEAADVHLVEIDLVLDGPRVFDFPGKISSQYESMLMANIRLGYGRKLYAFSLRERLPILPIPLRYSDDDITLDLQLLHDQCYRDGAYDDTDYSANPATLHPDHKDWIAELLQKAGHRQPSA